MKILFDVRVLVLLSQTVYAHGNLSHRHAAGTLRAEKDGTQTLDLMMTLNLVGPRATLITARFDLDRNGRFSNREASLFGEELSKEMLGGLELHCGSEDRLQVTDVQYKANQKNQRSIVVAALMKFSLSQPCSTLTLSARTGAQRKGLESVKLVLSAYPPLMLNDARRLQFELRPGQSKQILVGTNKTL